MTTTTATRTISTSGERYIGRNSDGDRVFIAVELRHCGPEFTTTGEPVTKHTVDHRTITEYDEISIVGCVVPKFCRNAHSFGQCREAVDNITSPAVPRDTIQTIRRLWNTRHLNGMHAGCIHQDANVPVPYDSDYKAIYAEQTAKCPEGYEYGSRWLVDVLSDEDTAAAREVIAMLANQPVYTGN